MIIFFPIIIIILFIYYYALLIKKARICKRIYLVIRTNHPAQILVCSGVAIPTIPGDNSHYVEGESRYIWMPDGEGVPQLVDLHEPIDYELLGSRSGANNQYWLFTRLVIPINF